MSGMDEDKRLNEAGERIASSALLDNNTTPELTFNAIIAQITNLLQEVPEEERSERRRKLMCVLEKKFAEMVCNDQESQMHDKERKKIIKSVADRVAAWMEGVIVEAESRIDCSQSSGLEGSDMGEGSIAVSEDLPFQGSDIYVVAPGDEANSAMVVANVARQKYSEERAIKHDVAESLRAWDLHKGPVKGTSDYRDWAVWIEAVTRMADDWGLWINQTVDQAKVKAALKRGEMLTSQGELERLTRNEWMTWKMRVCKEATNFTRINDNVQKTAVEWSTMFADQTEK